MREPGRDDSFCMLPECRFEKTILVVDDDEMNRRLLAALIEQLGHKPLLADSGHAALGMLDMAPDLVLMDVLMPGMDGYEVARRIRASGTDPDVPIIMVTTLDNKEDRLAAVQAGANDFISKPVERTELRVRMDSLLKMKAAQERARKYQQDLRREVQLLEQVVENSLQGITVTDAKGVIQKVNPAFTSITGYEAEEALGENPRILKSDMHDREFFEKMWRSLTRKGRWSGEIWNRRKNGEAYPERLDIVAIKDEEGSTVNYAGIFYDLTEIKAKEKEARFYAYHDPLTGLPNRFLLPESLEAALQQAGRANKSAALMYIDMDAFKRVNDFLGHHVGDRALKETARRLKRRLGEKDSLFRLSGDEFAVLIGDIGDEREITQAARRVLGTFRRPISFEDQDLLITASIGVAVYPEDGKNSEQLLKNSETAMFRAKELGKNSFSFFTPSMNKRIAGRMALESGMRRGLRNNEFEVYFQPRFELDGMRLTGMEALARWITEDGRVVGPGEFIPLAEETGLILPLGKKILRMACKHVQKLRQEGHPDLSVSVNLSPKQFSQENLVKAVGQILEQTGLPASHLELEITETCIMQDIATAAGKLKELSELGIKLSVDDFGTGYSSLYYLKKLPLNVLKIDRSFVGDLPGDPSDAVIVKTIIDLAENFNLHVVAEGVETEEQLDFLRRSGCRECQGYLLGRPMPVDKFRTFIEGRTSAGAAPDQPLRP